jgi:hypothetical protein
MVGRVLAWTVNGVPPEPRKDLLLYSLVTMSRAELPS